MADRKRTASISYRAFFSAPSMMSSVIGSTVIPVGISAIRSSSWVVDAIGSPSQSFGLMRMLKLTSTSAV
jgi:hypothetical protein